MKTRSFLLALLIITQLFQLQAGHVSKEKAAIVALNFYCRALNCLQPVDIGSVKISDTYTVSEKGLTFFYVFNIKDGGFVIVSAEDFRRPIIGYSFESNYSEVNPSPEFTWWMSGYKQQIKQAVEGNFTSDIKTIQEWNELGSLKDYSERHTDITIGPLITSRWNQGGPYNELCPLDEGCGHVLVGCVAVAMGQVINYYKYPLQGSGEHCYNGTYGHLCSTFRDSTYNYYAMINRPVASCIPLASLLYQCGIAVNMYYGCSGSGSYSDIVPPALINYFGYANTTQIIDRENYSQLQWENIIQQQLNEKKPMYYSGYGVPGGHAFNCDGYQVVGSITSYHFNWGWGGSSDGYFDINNVNGFNDGQSIIINSVPGSGYPYNCAGLKTLSLYDGVFEDGSGHLDYQPNMNCSWLISPPIPQTGLDHIDLIFDRFEISDPNDVVTIYNGETTSAPVLATYKGGTSPVINQILKSTTTKVLVTFTSNGTTSGGGWQISYSAKGFVHCSGLNTLTNSNYSFDDGSGPSYHYNNNTMCRWIIAPENASYIKIKFNQLQTESNVDFIKIYKGTIANNSNLLGTYSGSAIPDTILCPVGSMCIMFVTDGKNTSPGWSLTYKSDGTSQDINDPLLVSNINIFPNPASKNINIRFSVNATNNIRLTVADVIGNTVYSENLLNFQGSYDKLLDLSALAKGLYVLSLKTDQGTYNKKFVISD